MGDGQTPALSFGSPQQVRDQPRGGRHGTSRLRVSAEMPAGFWLGIGKEHRAHPGRDNMRRRGSLGARCSLRRGWAPAGPPPGSPGGGRPATGAWHGAGMAGSREPNPLALTLQRNFSSFGGEAVSLSSALGSAFCGWSGTGFHEGWASRSRWESAVI